MNSDGWLRRIEFVEDLWVRANLLRRYPPCAVDSHARCYVDPLSLTLQDATRLVRTSLRLAAIVPRKKESNERETPPHKAVASCHFCNPVLC